MDCKHATRLLSQGQERQLPWRQRLGLRLHLLLCDACAQFFRQLALLRAAIGSLARRIENDQSLVLPDAARERISKALAAERRAENGDN